MIPKKDKAIEEVKLAAKDMVTTVKRELESIPNPSLPVKNSNDFTITDLEKPTAFHLFREDFAPDNKIAFNGKFRSRWAIKYNAALAIKGTASAPIFELLDDVQINGPLGKNSLQLKFKQEKLSAQLDFNHHLIHNTIEASSTRQSINTYLNPYVYLETDRALHNPLFALGWMTYVNRGYRDHWRFNFLEKEKKLSWEIYHNLLAKYRGFYANWVLGFTFNDMLFFKDRKFMIGYDHKEINANVELLHSKGTFKEWNLDTVTASVSYDFRERGLLGILASHKATQNPQEKTFQEVAFGYRNKLRKDLEFKTKMSTKGLANFFFNYKVAEGLNIHTSFQGALMNKDKKGFLEMPFDFGVKIKLEN